ncbi:MAG: Card1-like endonuclease domain-containing protein [Thermodesulfovibrionales bacterium]
MSHVHVCLVSDQPIPNLTSVLHFKPDMVILLTTPEMKQKAKRLEEVLHNKGFNTKQISISAYEINNVIDECEKLLDQFEDSEVSLNITGGTKIGTLGTFRVFYKRDKPIYYVNTHDNEILQIFPEDKQLNTTITVKIPIKDYLAVYGFKVQKYVKEKEINSIYKRKKSTVYLAYLAVHAEHIIGEINYKLQGLDQFAYPYEMSLKSNENTYKLCSLLKEANLIKLKGKTTLEIPDSETARYLSGIWFEEYVYTIAKCLDLDEIKLNVEGIWDISGKHIPRNEFDILLSKGNRLFFISCKTANPERRINNFEEGIAKEYLYELDSISDAALGLFGKRMLASAREIKNDYVRKRAELLKIDLIDGKKIINLKEALRQWITK